MKTSSIRRDVVRIAAALLAVAFAPAAVMAQATYPSRPIRIIVPFGVATGVDLVARGLAEQLTRQMGVPLHIDNREGAGGALGTPAVQNAEPDGHTLLFTVSPPFSVQPLLQVKPSYDATRLTPVARVGTVAMSLVTSGKGRFKTFEEAAAFGEKNPGKLTYAHTGTGTLGFLSIERMNKERGIRMLSVPYKGAPQALMDTTSGMVDLTLRALSGVIPLAASGELRLLAVGFPTRLPSLPDVPTMAEVLKRPGFDSIVTYAVFGPPGMNPAHVQKLNAEVRRAMASPTMKLQLEKAAVDPAPSTPEELGALVRSEAATYRKLLDEIGVKPE